MAPDRGTQVRREVLGDAHVDAAQAATTAIDADFQRFITKAAWESVWARPDLDRATRSLVTIGLLAALGHEDELRMHLRAARNTGAATDDIAEVLLHVAVYAGVPAANAAFKQLKEEFGDEQGATS